MNVDTSKGFSQLPPRIKWDGMGLQVAGSVDRDEFDRVLKMMGEFRERLQPKRNGLIIMNCEPPKLVL